MNQRIKIILLPSLFLFACGIFTMILTTSCTKDDGSKCSKCESTYDCDSGLECFKFSNGQQRCAESVGDICFGLK